MFLIRPAHWLIVLVYLQPGEDVHQTVFSYSVHNALAVAQHGLKLRVTSVVRWIKAETTDDICDGPSELRRQIQGQSNSCCLKEDGTQRLGLCTDWGGHRRHTIFMYSWVKYLPSAYCMYQSQICFIPLYCRAPLLTTSLSHAAAQGDVFHYYHEHTL